MRLFDAGLTARQIAEHLPFPSELIGNENAVARNIDSIFEATAESLVWVRDDLRDRDNVLRSTPASIVICGEKTRPKAFVGGKCFILVGNPQQAFLRVLNDLAAHRQREQTGIHPSSVINAEAILGPGVSIGPFAVIGACSIGAGSIIGAHAVIHAQATIGERVHVREHCTIGGEGFGHILNESGALENMAHIGTVDIGDDVELFPFVNVDRATLGVTRIGNSTKIDHYCHIGHNSVVGESSVITARVTLSGGASVGKYSWIGIHSAVREGVKVGDECFLGMGSLLTKDMPDGESWAGSPARPLDELKQLQKTLRRLMAMDVGPVGK